MNMRQLLIVLTLLTSVTVSARQSYEYATLPVPVDTADNKVFDVVEQMPSFPGGQAALFQWLSSNIKYPVVAEENGVQGRVIVTFVVERDGSITDVKVVKSVDPSLDKEAKRVISSMPKWIPGKQNGNAVRVKYTVPVTFRLSTPSKKGAVGASLFTPENAMGRTSIVSAKYYVKDNKVHQINYKLQYPKECPELEKICSKFLFEDSVSTTLQEATEKYTAKISGGKQNVNYNYTTPDVVHTFSMDIIANMPGKCASYFLNKMVKDEQSDVNKSAKDQWNLAYDFRHNKLLSIDDIMIPEAAEKIKEKAGGKKIHLLVSTISMVWGYLQEGNLKYFELRYADSPGIYSDSFKDLVGRASFDSNMSRQSQNVIQNDQSGSSSTSIEGKVFDTVEQMPSFPGGQAALFQWLSSNLKYPVVAEDNGVQGRVIVTFVVERDGSITDVKVVKSVDPSLDKEAVRLVKSMPKWIPGKQKGEAVRVKYTVPVTFRLK